MKFIDINREFTAAASSYMAQGYYINAGTTGSQGEVAHIDLTNGTEIIRVLLTTAQQLPRHRGCGADCWPGQGRHQAQSGRPLEHRLE